MQILFIPMLLLIVSCAEATYDFRGITNTSSCSSAIAEEKEQGSIFVGTEKVEGLNGIEEYVLDGNLYSVPVKVHVLCLNKSKIMNITYVAKVKSEVEAKELHSVFEGKLQQIYGQPKRSTLFHSSAYTNKGKLLPNAKPWKYVSNWCRGDRVSTGVLSYTWHGKAPYYSVAVGVDFASIICE